MLKMIIIESVTETIVKRRIGDICHVRLTDHGTAYLCSESGTRMKKMALGRPVCEMSLNEFRDLLEICEGLYRERRRANYDRIREAKRQTVNA